MGVYVSTFAFCICVGAANTHVLAKIFNVGIHECIYGWVHGCEHVCVRVYMCALAGIHVHVHIQVTHVTSRDLPDIWISYQGHEYCSNKAPEICEVFLALQYDHQDHKPTFCRIY